MPYLPIQGKNQRIVRGVPALTQQGLSLLSHPFTLISRLSLFLVVSLLRLGLEVVLVELPFIGKLLLEVGTVVLEDLSISKKLMPALFECS